MQRSDEQRSKDQRVRKVLLVALGLNVAVAIAKIVAGRAALMLSIEADGYHSLTDGFGSVVCLVGLALAARPPSARYPYGHRKIEVMAAIAIGVSLLLMAANVAGEAVVRLQEGRAFAADLGVGSMLVLVVTLAVNFGISSYQAREGKRVGSALLLTDARHTRADCWVTLGVIAASVMTMLGQSGLDVAAAVVVAVLVGKAGVDILRENAGYLTDVALVEAGEVAALVGGIAPVMDVHSVRTRGTPGAIFMDLRIALPENMSIAAAGNVVEMANDAIRDEFPNVVDVVIHAEPVRRMAA